MKQYNTFLQKLQDRSAKIGVIGLGYVGLPLAVEFAKQGFHVIGFDVLAGKVDRVNSGDNYIKDVDDEVLRNLVDMKRLEATTSFELLMDCDAVCIAVPTPLRKTKDPDMSYVVAACEQAAQYLHPGMLVSLESTTFPGTTDELMLPMLQAAHPDLQVGYDFFLCFSPERVDPGNPMYNTSNTPKVVGGVTSQCTNAGAALYRTVVSKVIPVRGTRVAEMVKLLENTFRLINIGLVNEMAMMCDRMGVDIWEVIKAASTKPFGFMPFYPGMGVGGHCIAVDPFYLAWKTRQIGVEPRFIDLAGQVNGQMPHHAVRKIAAILNSAKKSVNGAKIHIMGMAYKRDIDDVRESPALDVTHLLLEDGAEITYYDPYVPTVVIGGVVYASCSEEIHRACIEAADCVVIAAAHTNVDYPFVLRTARAIFDPHNMLGGCPDEMGKLKVTH